MSRSSRNLGVRVLPPERPPKPKDLQTEEAAEPLYITTLPSSGPPNVPLKPKGILKNATRKPSKFRNSSGSCTPNRKSKEFLSENTEDVGHFELNIKESVEVDTEDQNSRNPLNTSNGIGNKGNPSSKKEKSKDRKTIKSKKSENLKQNSRNKRDNINNLPAETYSKALFAARLESMSGIMHLIVIVCSVITLTSMAILTNDWELMLRRCPLYVKTSQSDGVYWGNEKLAACHYASYMPAVTLIMSVSLIMFHGGILLSWRRGYEAYKIMLSKTYTKILFLIELLEMVIAISVAGVLIDGVRQTCLGFQLSPWSEERPENCKEGYRDRDEVYGISNTYVKLMSSMIASAISAVVLIIASIFYLVRINPCCKGSLRQPQN